MFEAYAEHMLAERGASCRGLWLAGQKRTRSAEVPGTRAASCIGSVRGRPRRLILEWPQVIAAD